MKIIKINSVGFLSYTETTELLNGNLHIKNNPAVEWEFGRTEWYLDGKYYSQINLKDYVVLDHYKGKCDLMWYKLLSKDNMFEYPDIPGLIEKE